MEDQNTNQKNNDSVENSEHDKNDEKTSKIIYEDLKTGTQKALNIKNYDVVLLKDDLDLKEAQQNLNIAKEQQFTIQNKSRVFIFACIIFGLMLWPLLIVGILLFIYDNNQRNNINKKVNSLQTSINEYLKNKERRKINDSNIKQDS